MRRSEARFEGAGGRSLFRRAWIGSDPKRVLVVVHGFGEHCGRYDTLGAHFARLGYAVHAYDQIGHGESPGPRGHVDAFEDFHDDLDRFLASVADEHPDLPRILLGHSMGGLVVASYAVARHPNADLLATSGAALVLSEDLSPLKLRLARLLRRVWPRLGMEAGLDLEGLSRDPDVARRYVEDPLVHGRATASLAAQMSDAIELAANGAARVRLPILMLHGGDDPLCKPSGTQRFFEGLPRDEVSGSALRVYPGLRHEIFNEPEHEEVFGDLHRWIDERCAERSASDGAASTGLSMAEPAAREASPE